MGYDYVVVGAGMQGVASAYDLARFGDAESVILADNNHEIAKRAAERINRLIGREIGHPLNIDAADKGALKKILANADGLLSAVPYKYNLDLTRMAVKTKTNMVDMGGHTGVVRKQLALNEDAEKAGVSIIPDCGMGPGMNITLALLSMSMLDKAEEVYIYDGGLPQDPRPPWNYALFFHINGLINEYDGDAYYLRNGEVTAVPALSELEEIEIPPLGRLEAFVTSGGLSTMPWTYEDKLKVLENKTLRYPGHCTIFQAYKRVGLFSEEPVIIGKQKVIPREMLFKLLKPQLFDAEVRDVCVINIRAQGTKNGKPAEARIKLIDYYDEDTDFRAMEKLTGWHAAIVLERAVRGEIIQGVISVEKALSGEQFLKETGPRNWSVEKLISRVD